jgi:hypothetical protein
MNVTDGIMRVRYRDSWESPKLMTPGEVVVITIEPFLSTKSRVVNEAADAAGGERRWTNRARSRRARDADLRDRRPQLPARMKIVLLS